MRVHSVVAEVRAQNSRMSWETAGRISRTEVDKLCRTHGVAPPDDV